MAISSFSRSRRLTSRTMAIETLLLLCKIF
jgi:hypothetical protein